MTKVWAGIVNYKKVVMTCMGAGWNRWVILFSKFVCRDSFQHWFPVYGEKGFLLFLIHGEHLSLGKFYGLFLGRKKGGQRAFSASAVS